MGKGSLERRVEPKRQRLKEAALAKAMEGIALLKQLGFEYELKERRHEQPKRRITLDLFNDDDDDCSDI